MVLLKHLVEEVERSVRITAGHSGIEEAERRIDDAVNEVVAGLSWPEVLELFKHNVFLIDYDADGEDVGEVLTNALERYLKDEGMEVIWDLEDELGI